MADVQTPNIKLIKPEVGASENTWGNKLNSNFDLLDSAIASKAAIAHEHNLADVKLLSDTLAGKADKKHGHAIDDIATLAAALAALSNKDQSLQTQISALGTGGGTGGNKINIDDVTAGGAGSEIQGWTTLTNKLKLSWSTSQVIAASVGPMQNYTFTVTLPGLISVYYAAPILFQNGQGGEVLTGPAMVKSVNGNVITCVIRNIVEQSIAVPYAWGWRYRVLAIGM